MKVRRLRKPSGSIANPSASDQMILARLDDSIHGGNTAEPGTALIEFPGVGS